MAGAGGPAAVGVGEQWARHPDDLPEGYHITGRGQAW